MIRVVSMLCAVLLLGGCSGFGLVPAGTYSSASIEGGVESGVGGTGFSDVSGDLDEGVGGTGISFGVTQNRGASEGVGGDEGVGGTGIFGIISAFGSIVVNGVHIDYEPGTPVSIDGDHGTPSDFAIGQLVSVEADPTPGVFGARYQARLIEIQHAVVGPVSDVDEVARTFIVLGQTVRVQSSDRLPDAGEWVKVSGLRDADGGVVATRIDSTLSSDRALVRGVVRADGGGALALGRLRLPVARTSEAALLAGDEVLVRGLVGADGFMLKDLRKAAAEPFGGRMHELIIEGYVSTPSDGARHIAGHAWVLPDAIMDRLPRGLSGGPDSLPLLMKGIWGDDAMVLEPSFRRSLPRLLEPLPWTLEGEELPAGEWPDLLRQKSDQENGGGATVDPTTLPRPALLRAALGVPGLPIALLNISHPLTSDQLSTILRLGGADLSGDGPITFDPTFLIALINNHERLEALSNGILSGDGLGASDRLALGEVFQRLQQFGLDASQLQAQLGDARLDPSLVRALIRVNRRLARVGLDPSSLPPQVLSQIQSIIRANRAAVARP